MAIVKKTTRVLFEYDDGSSEYAEGEHAHGMAKRLSNDELYPRSTIHRPKDDPNTSKVREK